MKMPFERKCNESRRRLILTKIDIAESHIQDYEIKIEEIQRRIDYHNKNILEYKKELKALDYKN